MLLLQTWRVPTILPNNRKDSGNLLKFNELTDEQRRQVIDVRQSFEAYRKLREVQERRYSGSMRWLTRKGRDYLHRKRGSTETSLGPRSPETETQFRSFREGREKTREELKRLSERLDRMAPVNRALELGRVPKLAARVLRRLDQKRLLRQHLIIIGTNALFCYEAKAGVVLESKLLATGDADLLWDARQRMALLLPEVRRSGVIGILQKVDRSFRIRGARDYRAFNADGYWVDLIRPQDRNFFQQTSRKTVGNRTDDLHGAAVGGLQWLISVPRFEAVAFGEDGYPVRLVTIDPRAFALHKLWLSGRSDRDPIKQKRDVAQAKTVAAMCSRYFNLDFDTHDLQALPASVRSLISAFEENGATAEEGTQDVPTPKW